MLQEDNPDMFVKLPVERQTWLLNWIEAQLQPRKTFNPKHTSYGIKQHIKDAEGHSVYYYNGEFKGAMRRAGYAVKDDSAQNWVFNVSEKSPLFTHR